VDGFDDGSEPTSQPLQPFQLSRKHPH